MSEPEIAVVRGWRFTLEPNPEWVGKQPYRHPRLGFMVDRTWRLTVERRRWWQWRYRPHVTLYGSHADMKHALFCGMGHARQFGQRL